MNKLFHLPMAAAAFIAFNAYAVEMSSFHECALPDASHAERVDCYAASAAAIQAQMQQAYDNALTAAQTSDQEMQAAGSVAMTGLEEALTNSQNTFTTYMEAECGRRAAYRMGSTMAADAALLCKKELMQNRIAILQSSF